MSDELVAWLRGVLDDVDSEAADVHVLDCELTTTAGFHGPCTCGWPDRLTADAAAKRQLLDAILGLEPSEYTRQGFRNGKPGTYRRIRGEDHRPQLLRLLAVPYADRPGFRDEWRPE